MNEPGEVTNVVDAFDDTNGNPFDLHLTLGYQHTIQNARIVRESYIGGNANPSLTTGGFTSYMNVAKYQEVTSRLNMRADIGVYKDIALYIRMPLILSNTRELTGVDGSDSQQAAILQGGYDGSTPQQLFSLPFKSPKRSGIEYLAFGLDFSLFNQFRDASKPTWVFGAEVRLNVSEPMHACKESAGPGVNLKNVQQVQCADPSDVNRNGVADGTNDGSFSGGRKPGVSRGTTGLEVHSIISRRIKYIEPYGGFRALFEFPTGSSDYGKSDLTAVLTSNPPLQGWMILGMQVIPYEVRESFQRLTLDARFSGTYRSQGRDYTPLFDAIGSSDDQTVRRPSYADYQLGPADAQGNRQSVVNPNSQKVYITGLTDTAAYGSLSFSGSAMFQAAEYIKFQLGMGYTYIQPHNISGDQPCNPDFKNDVGNAGPCQSKASTTGGSTTSTVTGIPNPLYRPALDAVGRRFRMDQASQIDIWVNAVVMF
ncbi:MAG: hypothetical protein U0165_00615 [Polyangiaceae bacterium]